MAARSAMYRQDNSCYEIISRELQNINSVFGRVVYLASFRVLYTGRYEHPLLTGASAAENADHVIRRCHQETFAMWLGFTLTQQLSDLDKFLPSHKEDRSILLHSWFELEPYSTFLPASATISEKELFLCDLKVALALFRDNLGTSVPLTDEHHGVLDRRVIFALRSVIEPPANARVTLRTLARQLGISEHYLGRLFKNEVGLSFHRYLRAVRMRKAGELLCRAALPLKEVAAATGYQDSSNFNHDFREFFRCTPKEYRLMHHAPSPAAVLGVR